jgi:acyl-CoA synthetase (AMP-forming)/AMP-acid ligase II
LKSLGVGKGDAVIIYLPMLLELPIAMLACARIGAVHSVIATTTSCIGCFVNGFLFYVVMHHACTGCVCWFLSRFASPKDC